MGTSQKQMVWPALPFFIPFLWQYNNMRWKCTDSTCQFVRYLFWKTLTEGYIHVHVVDIVLICDDSKRKGWMGLGKKSGIDLDKGGTERFVIEAVNYNPVYNCLQTMHVWKRDTQINLHHRSLLKIMSFRKVMREGCSYSIQYISLLREARLWVTVLCTVLSMYI